MLNPDSKRKGASRRGRSGTLRVKSTHRERFSAPELMLLFVLRTCAIITGEPKRSLTLGALGKIDRQLLLAMV